MRITPVMEFVQGSFDTDNCEMVCVARHKYASVELAIKSDTCFAVPFAEIKLYDSELWKDAKVTFEDAKKLGDEIARRWNAARKGGKQ